eukprot:12351391-Alexandrium_andersonii.AAC.1
MRVRAVRGDRWRADRTARAFPAEMDTRVRLLTGGPMAARSTLLTIHGGSETAPWPASSPRWVPPPARRPTPQL